MNYDEMSDFEINKLVARAVDGIPPNDDRTAIDCFLSHANGTAVKWFQAAYYDWDVFDPCNNPSDAWPIIMKIKHQLASQKFHWYMRANPLRAAMIVFLMMQEEE